MPWCLTSTARPAAKDDKNAFVAAYNVVKGEHIVAAADDVNTMPPLSFESICKFQILSLYLKVPLT